MSFHDYQSTGGTRVSEHISYTPDTAHTVFRYDDFMETMQDPGKRMDVLVMETAGLPMGDTWVVELKDYRILTRPPRGENSTGLPDTVERKIADTHSFLISPECPAELRSSYLATAAIHFCLHAELPAPESVAVPYLGVYRALVSVITNLATGRRRIHTPNHTGLEVLNAAKINQSPAYPWSAHLD